MKCPVCEFITNPQNDLCSRCFSDLRSAKTEMGLRIYQPDLSYEQLLATKVKIIQKIKYPEVEKVSKLTFVLNLAARFRKKAEVLQPEDEYAVVLKSESELAEVPQEQLSQVALLGQDPKQPKQSLGLRMAKRQKEQMLALLRRRKQKDQIKKSEQSAIAPEALILPSSLALDSETEELFRRCAAEVTESHTFTTSGAISGSELIQAESNTALKALFEVVAADLLQPERSRKYVDVLSLKRNAALESDRLEQAVMLYQKEDLDYQRKQALVAIKFNQVIEGDLATLKMRIKAWGIDFAFCLLFAAILAVLIELLTNSIITEILLGEWSFFAADLASLILNFFVCLVLARYLFLPIFRIWKGSTPGERMLNLRLVDQDNAANGIGLSFLWNLTEVITFLSLGLFECLKSARLAKQKICSAKILRC